MIRLLHILPSRAKGKRLTAVFRLPTGRTRSVHFGLAGGATYVDHGRDSLRTAYLARHGAGRESWSDPMTPGSLARWILWGPEKTIAANTRAYRRRFGI
jgi:hypothetical protein